MPTTLLCDSCGQRVPVPAGYVKPKMRCPECGVIFEVPVESRAEIPVCPDCGEPMRVRQGKPPICPRCAPTRIKPGVNPRGVSVEPMPVVREEPNLEIYPTRTEESTRIKPAASPRAFSSVPMPPDHAAAEPEVEGSDEDDGKPYRLPPDPNPKKDCPHCKKTLPNAAVVCNHCGINLETGEKTVRVHDEVDKTWDGGLGFRTRFSIFVAVQSVALAATIVIAIIDGDLFPLIASWIVAAGVLGFVLGTYPRVRVTRSKRGKVRILRTFHLCFIPAGTADIRWREYCGVSIVPTRDVGFLDWLVVVFLFPWGIIPAVLWWMYVIQPDQFDVALTHEHGCPAFVLYRGRSDIIAKEIASAIRNVTGLP